MMSTRSKSVSRVVARPLNVLVPAFAALVVLAIVPDARAQAIFDDPVPERYVLEYPSATAFATPTQTTYADAARALVKRGVRQHPNGGYGKAMMQIAGKPAFHTGADLSWFRVGTPVYAIADGVVRLSRPPTVPALRKAGVKVPRRGLMDWGNMIVIEHRLPEGDRFVTLYAHLGDDRRVRMGDVVFAGQEIGSIGRKSNNVNGGYEPHLHFGVREGTLLPKGSGLFHVPIVNRQTLVRLDEAGEETISLQMPEGTPDVWGVTLGGKPITVRKVDGRYEMPAWVLWNKLPEEAGLVGYDHTLDGWVDPLGFLKSRRAVGAAARIEPTWYDDEKPPANVTGKQAPKLQVDAWVRPLPDKARDVTDLSGRVVCVVFIQSDCRGSRSHALPTVVELARRYGEDPGVQFIVVQSPFRDDRRNTQKNLEEIAEALPQSVAVGHTEAQGKSPAAVVEKYALRATPWIVFIDRLGRVRLSGFHVQSESCVELIDKLKSETDADD